MWALANSLRDRGISSFNGKRDCSLPPYISNTAVPDSVNQAVCHLKKKLDQNLNSGTAKLAILQGFDIQLLYSHTLGPLRATCVQFCVHRVHGQGRTRLVRLSSRPKFASLEIVQKLGIDRQMLRCAFALVRVRAHLLFRFHNTVYASWYMINDLQPVQVHFWCSYARCISTCGFVGKGSGLAWCHRARSSFSCCRTRSSNHLPAVMNSRSQSASESP